MLVAKYWAEEKLTYEASHIRKGQKGSRIVIKRKGWSNESQEAVQRHAHERAQIALQEVLNHQQADIFIQRTECAPGYNGADSLPICEEIISTIGDTAITRNSYGALCLNTPDVMFVDIDQDSRRSSIFKLRRFLPLQNQALFFVFLFILLSMFFKAIGWAICLSLVIMFAINLIGNKIINKSLEARIDAFAAKNPTWCFNLYRTAAGFRLLILHQLFDPDDTKTWTILSALGVDPVYQRMCHLQKCFRARLTPKPWRIAIGATIPKGRVV